MDNSNNQKQKSNFVAIKVKGELKDSTITDNLTVGGSFLEIDGDVEGGSIERNKTFLSNDLPIEKVEIVEGNKTEQQINIDGVSARNKDSNPNKKWFSMNNPLVWIICSILLFIICFFLGKYIFPRVVMFFSKW